MNKKYTDRSINKVYSKLLCQFSNTINEIPGKNGKRGIIGIGGDNGTTGNIGNFGDKGYFGDTGFDGNDGNVGNKGNLGSDGSKGFAGSEGDFGSTGNTGDIGLFGDPGSNGFIGNTGSDGDIGGTENGNKGDIGETENGDKGDIGINGYGGNNGINGDKGDMGMNGSTGNTGIVGDSGDLGIKGNKGEGENGDNGNRGDQGIIGDPISPIDVYAFASNNGNPIYIYPLSENIGLYYPDYYPDSNLSANIDIYSEPAPYPNPDNISSTYFIRPFSGQNRIYLIMYDLKVNSTITSDTIFSTYYSENIINGSQIQAPNRYVQNTFVSFNRVFIAQVSPSGSDDTVFYCGASGVSQPSSITLINGINGPQISIIEIA